MSPTLHRVASIVLATLTFSAMPKVVHAADITVTALSLQIDPATGRQIPVGDVLEFASVSVRVTAFNVANRAFPVSITLEPILGFDNNNINTRSHNFRIPAGVEEVELVFDDNRAGVLKTARLVGIANVPQTLVVVMPRENGTPPPPALNYISPNQRGAVKQHHGIALFRRWHR